MLLFSSAYNEYTVISKEYTSPLDFDITGVDCTYIDKQIILIKKPLTDGMGVCFFWLILKFLIRIIKESLDKNTNFDITNKQRQN